MGRMMLSSLDHDLVHVHLGQRQEVVGWGVVERTKAEARGVGRDGDHRHILVAGCIAGFDHGEIDISLGRQADPCLRTADRPRAVIIDRGPRIHVHRRPTRIAVRSVQSSPVCGPRSDPVPIFP